MRKVLNFNADWIYVPEDIESAKENNFDDSGYEKVCLPHSNNEFPPQYFSEEEYRFISWYRREFELSKEMEGSLIKLEFEGVMNVATVYVNGKEIGEHKGGYTGFTYDITKAVNFGEINYLAVKVDSRRRVDVPPEGGNVDYMQFGGIYRNVYMKIVNPIYISDVFVIPEEVKDNESTLKTKIEIKNKSNEEKSLLVDAKIIDESKQVVEKENNKINISAGETKEVNITKKINDPRLWHPQDPNLYNLEVKLFEGEECLDNQNTRFGIREVEFRDDGKFYINGKPLKLRGLNRHQVFPYLGAAMPDRIQKKDADILKNELGLNLVRSSHYPPAPAFIEKCDEIGLLVFEEIPGWVYIGDEEWKDIAKQNVKEMVIRDRNHPSVILWGVRINESFNNYPFFEETNKIAHELDPSRQTGGVRYIIDSDFQEDVFTLNDFEKNLEGKLNMPVHVPSMVSEYMGHMFPTRSYDREERLIKHAELHAKIQDCSYGIPNLAGACGWCAFDYYTTSEFGAGNHICYHGVCDVFRLPKFAAHFYNSQKDPEEGLELFIARFLTPEFNDIGNDLMVYSNCDRVDLYLDGKKFDSQTPDYANFPNLPHPPFTFGEIQSNIKDKIPTQAESKYKWNEHTWGIARWLGERLSSIEVRGYIDGKEVIRDKIEAFGRETSLTLETDDKEIVANGSDCTRLVIEVKDEKGQVLPFAHNAIQFEVNGPGKLIGKNPMSVEAGRGAVFIKSTQEPGQIKIKATADGLKGDEIEIKTVNVTDK